MSGSGWWEGVELVWKKIWTEKNAGWNRKLRGRCHAPRHRCFLGRTEGERRRKEHCDGHWTEVKGRRQPM